MTSRNGLCFPFFKIVVVETKKKQAPTAYRETTREAATENPRSSLRVFIFLLSAMLPAIATPSEHRFSYTA